MSSLGVALAEVLAVVTSASALVAASMAGRFYLQLRKIQQAGLTSHQKMALDIETHRDGLTFELLETARAEIAALRSEVERRRIGEQHIQHFEDALSHIEALLLSENDADRKAAERAARAFLNRMRRMQEAKGIIANELQRIESEKTMQYRSDEDHD